MNLRPPFQALFISEVVPGAVHDVSLFRQGYERYKVYLKKSPEERRLLPGDPDESFALLADKGYTGTFPGLRIITPRKIGTHSQTPASTPVRGYPPASSFPTTGTISPLNSMTDSPNYLARTSSLHSAAATQSSNPASSSSSSSSSSTEAVESYDEYNKVLARVRIPVEWFFGRLKRIWLRLGCKSSSLRDNLPGDLKIACYLTNLSILYKSGNPEDIDFYQHDAISRRSDRSLEEEISNINSNARQQRQAARHKYRMGMSQSAPSSPTGSQHE